MYYNSKTNSLQSNPPWTGWLHPDIIAERYDDWERVDEGFTPPVPIDQQKGAKLQQIDSWTASAITGGFTSAAMGVMHAYDSESVDQDNIKLMHQASMSPSFASDPVYKGHVPIRAIPFGQMGKVILMHDESQLQILIDDMARHIGACKVKGWQLQAAVAAAQTKEEVDAITWPV